MFSLYARPDSSNTKKCRKIDHPNVTPVEIGCAEDSTLLVYFFLKCE